MPSNRPGAGREPKSRVSMKAGRFNLFQRYPGLAIVLFCWPRFGCDRAAGLEAVTKLADFVHAGRTLLPSA